MVTVTKTSSDDDETRRHDETPSPRTTPLWTRKNQFTVDPEEEVTEEGFITEPGAFYFEAELENGEYATAWNGFYDAAGGGIAEDAIFVSIHDHGRMTVFGTHSD